MKNKIFYFLIFILTVKIITNHGFRMIFFGYAYKKYRYNLVFKTNFDRCKIHWLKIIFNVQQNNQSSTIKFYLNSNT